MKLPQLHLRDLFWLVLVCGLSVAWRLEHRKRAEEAERHAHDANLIRSLHETTQTMMEMRNAEENATATDYSGFLIEVIEDPPGDPAKGKP